MEIKPVADYHGPLTTKFGIPRQSGLIDLPGEIVFRPAFRSPDAVRGRDAVLDRQPRPRVDQRDEVGALQLDRDTGRDHRDLLRRDRHRLADTGVEIHPRRTGRRAVGDLRVISHFFDLPALPSTISNRMFPMPMPSRRPAAALPTPLPGNRCRLISRRPPWRSWPHNPTRTSFAPGWSRCSPRTRGPVSITIPTASTACPSALLTYVFR